MSTNQTQGPTLIEGKLDARSMNVAVVLSRFNSRITESLLKGAVDCLIRHGGEEKNLTIVRVPGAFEIPLAAAKAAQSGKFKAVIGLGAVVRGDTPHFDFVASEATRGMGRAAYESGIPVAFGLITTEDEEQALARSGGKAGNKGWDAAMTAMEMVSVMESLS
ncbi:MAG: 6,7-dimethyl-8-ribityllumazine synthase [Spirochaetales bacterium]|nr:6,7-dimethyl-8-ribityllumazine synthase [Spirochaetales bacterium]